MTPVIPCSINNISLVPSTAFSTRKSNYLTRFNYLEKFRKTALSSQGFILPLSTSVRLFPTYRSGCALRSKANIRVSSATGTNIAVDEPGSPIADKDSDRTSEIPSPIADKDSDSTSEIPSNAVETSEESPTKIDASASPAQSKRSRPFRKSEMPPVTNEELVPGATFIGKVKSIQPFGAFVDFGAFTDGLVHVSRLSDSFVKDVGNIVSVGQEVKVRLVDVNHEAQRISLSMRESDDTAKLQQRKDATAASDNARPARRNTSKSNRKKDDAKKSSKFVKGQDLEGTVKNMVRSGSFISLPEGEEGFLPTSEESVEGFGNVMGGSSLQVGQEVSVRVLRIIRGQVTLTMKKEEDIAVSDSMFGQGVVHVATNPFVLAFRKNRDVAAFLDEREKIEKPVAISEIPKTSDEIDGKGAVSTNLEVQDPPAGSREELFKAPAADALVKDVETSLQEVDVGTNTVNETSVVIAVNDKDLDGIVSNSSESLDGLVPRIEEKLEVSPSNLAPEGRVPSADQITEENSAAEEVEKDVVPNLSGDIADQSSSSGGLVSEEIIENKAHNDIAKDKVQIPAPTVENEIADVTPVDDEKVDPIPEKSSIISNSDGQIDISSRKGGLEYSKTSGPSDEVADDQLLSSEIQVGKDVVENQVDNSIVKDEVQVQTPIAENEVLSAALVEGKKEGSLPEKNGSSTNSSAQSGASSPKEGATKVTISPALVKQLREETGAGMMDCKKALSETGGDIVKAQEFLRKKGLASADKKASRATAEGRIGSYIHDGRIGILIEVNCETDFVSRGDIFKELVDDLAMQVAACPQVQFLVTEDVPEEIVNKEREIEMQKEDLLSKPEEIRSKIVEGRIRKRLEELALLEQPYIKDDKVVVKNWVKQTIATIGENIKVKRFVRFNLGEGLEKKSQDFAAEVAAQTAAKPSPMPGKEQPIVIEAKETVQKPTMTVSAALVKQLREETGAGMMDCKKALSETGGDLEKAQEYLRKKGLSTADKKSSRLAAEGRIGSYIHDSRIGVLIEVNCETDFVGRSEKFKELVDDLAMQVVACPQVQFVCIEDIPDSIVRKEKELEMQREDLLSKPENIRERIIEGRVSKRLGELALLEQPFIKNDSVLVKDLVKQTVAAIGENIKVRRFVRFTLGEATEDAEVDIAA